MGLFSKEKDKIVVVAENNVATSTVNVAAPAPIPSVNEVNPEIGYFSGSLTPFGNFEPGYRYKKNGETLSDKKLAIKVPVSRFEKKIEKTYLTRNVNELHDYYNVIVESVLYGYLEDREDNNDELYSECSLPLQVIPICEQCRTVPVVEIQSFSIYAGKVIFYCRNHKDDTEQATMPLHEFFEYFPEYSLNFVKHMKSFTPTVIESNKTAGLRFAKDSDVSKVQKGAINVISNVEKSIVKDVEKTINDSIAKPTSGSIESKHSETVVEQTETNATENIDDRVKRGEEFDSVIAELVEQPYSAKTIFLNK